MISAQTRFRACRVVPTPLSKCGAGFFRITLYFGATATLINAR
jgi:hypothetical protein